MADGQEAPKQNTASGKLRDVITIMLTKKTTKQMIGKVLVGASMALIAVGLAAPASADTNPIGTDPNPFGALSCSCETPASVTSPDVTDQINRGIQDALAN